jgi:4-amino-4-deoxy-L-arabinose transferase-like glycosyltransferase
MQYRRLLPKLLLVAILLVGGFLRFGHLDAYGLWSDEFVTLQLTQNASYRALIHDCFVIPQPIPPLYFLITKLFVDTLGPSEISLRLLSALAGTLTLGLLYWLGKEWFGEAAGFYAVLLLAFQPAQLVYAQNARAYAFCLLLCTASMLFMTRWIREEKNVDAIGFIFATTLLFYSHYVFAPLLLIFNLYFLLASWRARQQTQYRSPSWRRWLILQACCVFLLLPLSGQVLKVIQSRHSLNWSSHQPDWHDFFKFVDFPAVGKSLLPALLLGIAITLIQAWTGKTKANPAWARTRNITDISHSLPLKTILLLLWFIFPPALFGVLYLTAHLNLFVENYLMISSIPTSLFLSAMALQVFDVAGWQKYIARFLKRPKNRTPEGPSSSIATRIPAHLFLILLLLWTIYGGIWTTYRQRGIFSQGVPGGNEWRDSLREIQKPGFQPSSLLFQSPYIESNQLDFRTNSRLHAYLSAPLYSFYLPNPPQNFELLPVFWNIENLSYQQFKADVYGKILVNPDFVLLSTQRFWNEFLPWLQTESHGKCQVQIISEFTSPGALMLHRVRLNSISPVGSGFQ